MKIRATKTILAIGDDVIFSMSKIVAIVRSGSAIIFTIEGIENSIVRCASDGDAKDMLAEIVDACKEAS